MATHLFVFAECTEIQQDTQQRVHVARTGWMGVVFDNEAQGWVREVFGTRWVRVCSIATVLLAPFSASLHHDDAMDIDEPVGVDEDLMDTRDD